MFSTLVHVIDNAGLCNADRSTGTSVPLDCFLTTTAICHETISYSEAKRLCKGRRRTPFSSSSSSYFAFTSVSRS
jgi:hypothetical protein